MPLTVHRGGAFRPPRTILYGAPKVGKSTFGSEADNPIFVTTEDGVANIAVDQTSMARTWDEFVANTRPDELIDLDGSRYGRVDA